MVAAHRHSAPTAPAEHVCRSIRAAQSRYRALSRSAGALAPKTAPEPHARAVRLAHSPTWAGSATSCKPPLTRPARLNTGEDAIGHPFAASRSAPYAGPGRNEVTSRGETRALRSGSPGPSCRAIPAGSARSRRTSPCCPPLPSNSENIISRSRSASLKPSMARAMRTLPTSRAGPGCCLSARISRSRSPSYQASVAPGRGSVSVAETASLGRVYSSARPDSPDCGQ